MFQPEELRSPHRLVWSYGKGVDVWNLFCDCVEGNLVSVRELVDSDPKLVHSHYSYRSPLYFAVRENRLDIAEFLLDRGADPFAFDFGDSLIQIAADRGHKDLEQFLRNRFAKDWGVGPEGEKLAELTKARNVSEVLRRLDSNPDWIRSSDRRSNQPIHWATMTRQPELVDELLRRGANINASRSDGARPIHLFNGDYYYRGWRDVPKDWEISDKQMLDHLLKQGAVCDLATACHLGDMNRITGLLREDPGSANRVADYVSYYLGSGAPLTNAAKEGHLEIVELLLKHGADPNLEEIGIAPNGHALYSAVVHQHMDIAKVLLEHGAHPNPEVESSADALSIAISNEDIGMIELLCSYGASRGVPLLGYYGDVQTAAAIFEIDPSLANNQHALTHAAWEGHEPFVRLLLRLHPNLPKSIDFPDWISAAKTPELNELLFAHGMDPSQPNWLGVTPLHRIAKKGDIEMAEVFIRNGANIHVRDEELCSTPLGWAAKFGQTEMVRWLLEHGASANHPDDPEWATPIAWAHRRRHEKILELLR